MALTACVGLGTEETFLLPERHGIWALSWPSPGLGGGGASWREAEGSPGGPRPILELWGWDAEAVGPRQLAEASGRPWPRATPSSSLG